MFRLSSSLCPFCEVRALSKALQPAWQTSRTAATLQKRKPSRMTLSPNVKRGPPKPVISGKPEKKKSRNSPWGGMNVTTAPPDVEAARNRAVAGSARRRTSQGNSRDERSKDPMKALKMQRALANISYEKRGRIKETLVERDAFSDFELLPVVQESISSQALGGMNDVSPTPIQRLAIPALLGTAPKKQRRRTGADGDMEQFLLAAETGSGKTLAYVLPVVDAIKRAEAIEALQDSRKAAREAEAKRRQQGRSKMFELEPPDADEPDPSTARPRAIILVPTSELVDQVGNLVKSLSHKVKFRSALISANYTGKVIRSRLFSTAGIDIVVSTPHLISNITESDPNILSRVSHLVIDEADSLLDRSFSPITSSIIDRASPSLKQLIFCSATIPRSLDHYLEKRYPNVRRLVTPNLHAIPRRVQLSVVDIDKVPYQGNRDLACAQVLWDIGKEANEHGEDRIKKIVVFVNEREKATELAKYLQSKGIDAFGLSRDSDERSMEVLAEFTGLSTESPAPHRNYHLHKPSSSFDTAISPADLPYQTRLSPPSKISQNASARLLNTRVLVTTDIASRGIDTLPVKHVILYDVPHTSIDFIHRLGRVGRMNRRGRGVVLVGKGDRRDVVREVRDGMFRGAALI